MGERGTLIAESFKRKADHRGTTATFLQIRSLTFDPATGAVTQDAPSFEASGFFDAQREHYFTQPGGVTIARAKGKSFLLPAFGITTELPRSGDQCRFRIGEIDEKHYLIGEVEPLTADDVVTCYRLELKDA